MSNCPTQHFDKLPLHVDSTCCVSMVTLWSSLWRGTFLIGTLLEHSFLFILIRHISISFQIIPVHSQYSLFIPKNTFSFMFFRFLSKDYFKVGCYWLFYVCVCLSFLSNFFLIVCLFLSCFEYFKVVCCFFCAICSVFCVLLRFW